METISYFLIYFIPIILSFFCVIALTLLNYGIHKLLIPVNHTVETIEVLAYSIVICGPIAYALFFIFFFYGLEILRGEDYLFAKTIFSGSIVLLIIGLVLDILFFPRL